MQARLGTCSVDTFWKTFSVARQAIVGVTGNNRLCSDRSDYRLSPLASAGCHANRTAGGCHAYCTTSGCHASHTAGGCHAYCTSGGCHVNRTAGGCDTYCTAVAMLSVQQVVARTLVQPMVGGKLRRSDRLHMWACTMGIGMQGCFPGCSHGGPWLRTLWAVRQPNHVGPQNANCVFHIFISFLFLSSL
jgi:hypothetical protein